MVRNSTVLPPDIFSKQCFRGHIFVRAALWSLEPALVIVGAEDAAAGLFLTLG